MPRKSRSVHIFGHTSRTKPAKTHTFGSDYSFTFTPIAHVLARYRADAIIARIAYEKNTHHKTEC